MSFNKYPYTDFHELNQDWMLNEFKDIKIVNAETKATAQELIAESTQKAQEALASANAASNSENAAFNYAQNANASATLAGTYADNASSSANEASETVSSTKAQIELIQSRVDNIIPSGTQTEGNTELIDIRVGADGVTYDSAGNAVRGQYSKLNKLNDTLCEFVETAKSHSSNYYKITSALDTDGIYALHVTVSTSGTYEIKCGTDASASYMVDTIGSYYFEAGVEKTIYWYIPTGEYTYFRLSENVQWDLDLYRLIDVDTIDKKSLQIRDELEVYVDDDIARYANVYTVGFTGTLQNGFTYDGTTDNGRLRLEQAFVEDAIYIVEFDVSYTAGECVGVSFSSADGVIDYKTLCYNGTGHVIIPVKNTAKGRYLNFWVENKVQFTITNITARKLNESGKNKVLLDVKTLMTKRNNNLGFWNVIVGADTAKKAIGSTRTIAIGNFVLGSLLAGNRNIGIGTFAMSQMTGGENNVSVGADSMLAVKEGHDNVAIGKSAMYNGNKLEDNIAIGDYSFSGSSSRISKYNVVIGHSAGTTSNGTGNTLIGHQAGYRLYTGDYNTMIGFNSLGRNNGFYNICIGNNTEFAENASNTIAIGREVKATKSGQMILGSSHISEVIMCGNKKINFNADGTVTWETI